MNLPPMPDCDKQHTAESDTKPCWLCEQPTHRRCGKDPIHLFCEQMAQIRARDETDEIGNR